jgi:hypothetical protein
MPLDARLDGWVDVFMDVDDAKLRIRAVYLARHGPANLPRQIVCTPLGVHLVMRVAGATICGIVGGPALGL